MRQPKPHLPVLSFQIDVNMHKVLCKQKLKIQRRIQPMSTLLQLTWSENDELAIYLSVPIISRMFNMLAYKTLVTVLWNNVLQVCQVMIRCNITLSFLKVKPLIFFGFAIHGIVQMAIIYLYSMEEKNNRLFNRSAHHNSFNSIHILNSGLHLSAAVLVNGEEPWIIPMSKCEIHRPIIVIYVLWS